MVDVTTKRCDVCGEDRPAQTYGLTIEGQQLEVDLCDDDAEPVHELATVARPVAGEPRRGHGTHDVVAYDPDTLERLG